MNFYDIIGNLNQADVHSVTRTTPYNFIGSVSQVLPMQAAFNTGINCVVVLDGVAINFEATLESPLVDLTELPHIAQDVTRFFQTHTEPCRIIPSEGTQENKKIQLGGIDENGNFDLDLLPEKADSYDYYDGTYLFTDTYAFLSASLVEQINNPKSELAQKITKFLYK